MSSQHMGIKKWCVQGGGREQARLDIWHFAQRVIARGACGVKRTR